MLPDRSIFNRTKIGEKGEIQMRHFGQFSNNVHCAHGLYPKQPKKKEEAIEEMASGLLHLREIIAWCLCYSFSAR